MDEKTIWLVVYENGWQYTLIGDNPDDALRQLDWVEGHGNVVKVVATGVVVRH